MQIAVYLHAPHLRQTMRSTDSKGVATLSARFEQRAVSDSDSENEYIWLRHS